MDVSGFIRRNLALCICTAGLAIVGYIGFRAVKWIIDKCHDTHKVDQVGRGIIRAGQPPKANTSMSDRVVALGAEEESKVPEPADEGVEPVDVESTLSESEAGQRIAAFAKRTLSMLKQEVHLVSRKYFKKAKDLVGDPFKLRKMSKASHGLTTVYLPQDLPIVLKKSGKESEHRFERMQQARQLCKEKGAQNLVIPEARVHGDFIIETRVPVLQGGDKECMGLYFEHRDQFTPVVKEFTTFMLNCTLYDITGSSYAPYAFLGDKKAHRKYGRYDNISIYLKDGVGKIGLIDLETFKPVQGKSDSTYGAVYSVVCFFPYHFDEIMAIARTQDPSINDKIKKLEEVRDVSMRRHEVVYGDHRRYFDRKVITLDDPQKDIEVSVENQEKIKEKLLKLFKEEHEGKGDDFYPWKGFLGKSGKKVEEKLEKIAQAYPQIQKLVLDAIRKELNQRFNRLGEGDLTYEKLAVIRTLRFDANDFAWMVENKIEKLLPKLPLKGFHRKNLYSFIAQTVLEGLAETGDIAYINPELGNGGYARAFVFC